MKKWLQKWLQKWLGLDNLIKSLEYTNKQLQHELAEHKLYVHDKVNKFLEDTRIDCDLGMRGQNTIILTGVYKNRGYVEFYDVDNASFHYHCRY